LGQWIESVAKLFRGPQILSFLFVFSFWQWTTLNNEVRYHCEKLDNHFNRSSQWLIYGKTRKRQQRIGLIMRTDQPEMTNLWLQEIEGADSIFIKLLLPQEPSLDDYGLINPHDSTSIFKAQSDYCLLLQNKATLINKLVAKTLNWIGTFRVYLKSNFGRSVAHVTQKINSKTEVKPERVHYILYIMHD